MERQAAHFSAGIPPGSRASRVARDGAAHHITLATKSELQSSSLDPPHPGTAGITSLGLGFCQGVWFVVVRWPEGAAWRARCGLPAHDFHITLGFEGEDRHDICKDGSKLRVLASDRAALAACLGPDMGEAELRTIADLARADGDRAVGYAASWALASRALHSKAGPAAGALALGEAMLADASTAAQVAKAKWVMGMALLATGDFARAGATLGSVARDPAAAASQREFCFAKASEAWRQAAAYSAPHDRVEHVGTLDAKVLMPRNFSWVVPGEVLGCSIPKRPEQIAALVDMNVASLITLCEESPLEPAILAGTPAHFRHHFVRLPNYEPPTVAQADLCMAEMESCVLRRRAAVMVHCGGGKGRAGTVLACFLFKHRERLGLPLSSGSDAVRLIRELRPGSIETRQQEDFVRHYAGVLHQRAADPQPLRAYPSTRHLPFSPGVSREDKIMGGDEVAVIPGRQGAEVVVTEKMDGGNCCLTLNAEGTGVVVYARTHGHPSEHPWFDPVKDLAREGCWHEKIPAGWLVFGETMTAVHSIEYPTLGSHLYIFGVFDTLSDMWLAWEDVEWLAGVLGVPTAPVVFRGAMPSNAALRRLLEREASQPSRACPEATPEGFVVRSADRFPRDDFEARLAKFVRANHVQTEPDFRRNWKRANVDPNRG